MFRQAEADVCSMRGQIARGIVGAPPELLECVDPEGDPAAGDEADADQGKGRARRMSKAQVMRPESCSLSVLGVMRDAGCHGAGAAADGASGEWGNTAG